MIWKFQDNGTAAKSSKKKLRSSGDAEDAEAHHPENSLGFFTVERIFRRWNARPASISYLAVDDSPYSAELFVDAAESVCQPRMYPSNEEEKRKERQTPAPIIQEPGPPKLSKQEKAARKADAAAEPPPKRPKGERPKEERPKEEVDRL